MYALFRYKAAVDAWYWAVHFKRRGKLHSTRFYDIKWGGASKARAAAIAWRDQMLAEVETSTVPVRHFRVRGRNQFCKPGFSVEFP